MSDGAAPVKRDKLHSAVPVKESGSSLGEKEIGTDTTYWFFQHNNIVGK